MRRLTLKAAMIAAVLLGLATFAGATEKAPAIDVAVITQVAAPELAPALSFDGQAVLLPAALAVSEESASLARLAAIVGKRSDSKLKRGGAVDPSPPATAPTSARYVSGDSPATLTLGSVLRV